MLHCTAPRAPPLTPHPSPQIIDELLLDEREDKGRYDTYAHLALGNIFLASAPRPTKATNGEEVEKQARNLQYALREYRRVLDRDRGALGGGGGGHGRRGGWVG